MSVEEAARRVLAYDTRLVEITGGEPLEQEGVYPLMRLLLDAGRTVLLETGGHAALDRVDPRVVKIVDVKAPGSGMMAANLPENLAALGPRDELKFVLADRADFDWALAMVARKDLDEGRVVTFSPVWNGLSAPQLAEWIRDSGRDIRLGLQVHKLLWGEVAGR
jgi:7-carboxy-7-deazaguanine synthase